MKKLFFALPVSLILLLSACQDDTGVTPDSTPPTVNLSVSSNTLTAAGNVTLTATASDASGIASVKFYRGSTLLFTDTQAPYTTTDAISASGTYSYTAVATDASTQANTATSSAATVTATIGTGGGGDTGTTDAQTQAVVAAANAFLNTLSAAQKTAVSFAFTDSTQRAKWSNLPTGLFQRNGVKWGDLSAAQQTALTTLLGTVLSADGLKMVQQQMDSDEVLLGTDGGGRLIFGRAEYYVSFLGTPSETSPWMLQFGGHHLAINATVVGKNIILAPSLTGGQPVKYTLNGQTVYIVEKEVTDSFAMVNSLDATQKAKAVKGSSVIDLVLGAGQDGKTLQPEGLAGSEMTAAQKTQFLTLIKDRLGALNADDLAEKMTTIEANLNSTYFAWYGPTTAGSAAYYRVTGPTVLIEFSPQQMGGDATNHIHSMYRDPTNDYGVAWTK